MRTKLTYRLSSSDGGGYVATCVEAPVESLGRTPEEALQALRRALEARLGSVEAVGPPSRPRSSPQIDLIAAVEESERDPQGPGDP